MGSKGWWFCQRKGRETAKMVDRFWDEQKAVGGILASQSAAHVIDGDTYLLQFSWNH